MEETCGKIFNTGIIEDIKPLSKISKWNDVGENI